MSNLKIDQKTIFDLLQEKKSIFLIPSYQRQYEWGINECQTLWDDIVEFAFPDNGRTPFDSDNEYFLGPIVTFKNEDGKKEIIDGQQRLTTILLLLRAFYPKFTRPQDEDSRMIKENIEKCIWQTNIHGRPTMDLLKIDSEVVGYKDKDEFLKLLQSGNATGMTSRYAKNFMFFTKQVNDFASDYPVYIGILASVFMNNCVLLPIEANSLDTSLRIFSTLNNRGKPLADADIFKAQLYQYYANQSKQDVFNEKWKELEELCGEVFGEAKGNPMDELFTQYMYYARAKKGIKNSTTEALRKFYEQNNYDLLKSEITFNDLITLAYFWKDIVNQNSDRFSEKVLRELFVLNYAPNALWSYFTSVYFMQNKDEYSNLDDDSFYTFLRKTSAFVLAYTIFHPGMSAMRTPIYAEMVNIVNDIPVSFSEYCFEKGSILSRMAETEFYNQRPITKSILAWWAFRNRNQSILPLESSIDIEHIYPRSRQEKEGSINNEKNIESLGNKSLLERRINIRASDYRFEDKKKYYLGFTNKKGIKKEGTKIEELRIIAEQMTDFKEEDIVNRSKAITDSFVNFLEENNLLLPERNA